jgi:hypothetical protein
MGLSADQQAMLQLLLERGQRYDDLSSLLGVEEPDVRARARAALTELGGADPDRNVALSDWLLGQADPIGRADVVRHLKDDPDDHALAAELSERLREVAPGAELPKLPPPPRGGPSRRRPAMPEPDAGPPAADAPDSGPAAAAPAPGLTGRQGRLLVALGCGALILLVAVLAIAGVFSGDEEESPATTGPNAQATGTDQVIARVPLRPTGGSDASGEATFGIANGRGYMDLTIEGLRQAPEEDAYIVWLLISPDRGHPLAPVTLDSDGGFDERIRIEDFILDVAARTRVVDVSLASRRELADQLRTALEQATPLLDYTGTSVLRGRVPLERDAGAGASEGGDGSPG